MNNRGFTVLEMVVALGMAIILTGLVFNAIQTTRRAVTGIDNITDYTTEASDFFRITGQLVRNIQADQPHKLSRESSQFHSIFQGIDVEVFIGNDEAANVAVVKIDGITRSRFSGQVEFRYFTGSEEWLQDWHEEHAPVSVLCALIPRSEVLEPWELIVNTYAAKEIKSYDEPDNEEPVETRLDIIPDVIETRYVLPDAPVSSHVKG